MVDKKILIMFLGIFLVLSLLSVNASAVCIENITAPEENRTYTYSINLPLEYNLNESSCEPDSVSYYLNLSRDNSIIIYDNVSSSGSPDKFDVDYDGNYTLTLSAVNSVSMNEENTTVTFEVYRSEFTDSKPILMISIVIVLLFIIFFIFYFSKSIDDQKHLLLKLLFTVLPFLMIITVIELIILAMREYIKVPALQNAIETFSFVFFWAVIVIMLIYIFIFVFVKIYRMMQNKKNEKFEGLTKNEY